MDISIVIPVYNEEESLPKLTDWIKRVMQANDLSYEVIFIDDGSVDSSWEVINEITAGDRSFKGIQFTRNYGKSAALQTGFEHVSGDVVVTMDADLQDSPDEIPELRNMIINQGYDLVSGWKRKRHDPLNKTIPSKIFNFITSKVSGIELHDFNCGLKAYKKKVVKNINVYGEMHRYIPLIAKWNGFKKIGEKVVEHRAREFGVTKYGWQRFITGFLDLLSVTFVTRFKKSPMHFFGTLGTLFFLIGSGITVWLIGEKLYYYKILNDYDTVRSITDQPLFFLALLAVVIGTQLFLAGFLAELMTQSKKGSADYQVSSKTGFEL
ncbi:MAG: glycosyltransferase family 2 protein [Bacteroidota bacterium]